MIFHTSIVVLVFVLIGSNIQLISGQTAQGGTITYKVTGSLDSNNNVQVKVYHSFLQVNTASKDEIACNGTCLDSTIDFASLIQYYRASNITAKERFDSSTYCSLYNKKESIAVSSRENFRTLNYDVSNYEFTFADCCSVVASPKLKPTYYGNFVGKFSLARKNDSRINNPPDTSKEPLYFEMTSVINKEKKLSFSDSDGDTIQCSWASNTCATGGDCTLFSLNKTDCSLKLLKTLTGVPIFYQVGIVISDYNPQDKTFSQPLSTVPFYAIVKLVPETIAINPNDTYICPEKTNNSNLMKSSFLVVLFSTTLFLLYNLF